MSTVNPGYTDPGRAVFEELDTYVQSFLLAGSHPPLVPAVSFELAASTVLEQFTVVGLNSTGKLVKATWDADPALAIKPIGVVPHAATSGPTGVVRAPVWYSGAFNIDALVWDASFDTDAKKLVAFHGAPTPTTIVTAKR